MLCGIDEAGRGSLAGPLVVAGVILHEPIKGLDDSKKLTPKKREELFEKIISTSSYEIVWTDNKTIDEIGLSKSIKLSIIKIKESLSPSKTVMDGNTTFGVSDVEAIIGADSKVAEVSAASILAKVSRDRYMLDIDKLYPNYGFASHKGYGTKAHIEAIKRYGLSLMHRESFKPKALRKSLFD
jgi:ribonuclease HII